MSDGVANTCTLGIQRDGWRFRKNARQEPLWLEKEQKGDRRQLGEEEPGVSGNSTVTKLEHWKNMVCRVIKRSRSGR